MSLDIVFAGTPELAREILEALIKGPYIVQAVFTQPDRPAGRGRTLQASPVKQLAMKSGLPVYQPTHLRSSEATLLQRLNPDVMVVAAYGLLLPAAFLAIPRYGCINLHFSLLPSWRGASPIQHAILAGDQMTGVTLIQMDPGLDTGDILNTYPCAIAPDETSGSLQHRLVSLGKQGLAETLNLLEQNRLCPQKQDHARSTYAPKLTKQDAEINWSKSAIQLDREIRAFNPWPIAFTTLNTQTLRIFSAHPLPAQSSALPGTLIQATTSGLDIATGDGILRVLETQLPGGKRMPISQLLHSKAALFQAGIRFSTGF